MYNDGDFTEFTSTDWSECRSRAHLKEILIAVADELTGKKYNFCGTAGMLRSSLG